MKVTELCGTFVPSELPAQVLVTVHPSSILRGPPEDRARSFAALVDDLKQVTLARGHTPKNSAPPPLATSRRDRSQS